MRKDTLKTRLELIKAAERLFAGKGIEAVTMADVNRAAGQKNSSAAVYHFGNKAGLVEAILDRHSEQMEARRKQLLETTDPANLDQVIQALMLPFIEKLNDADGGEEFLRIHGQLMTSVAYTQIRESRAKQLPYVRKLHRMLNALLPKVSRQELEARMICFESLLFQSMLTYLVRDKKINHTVFVRTLLANAQLILKATI